ncbi:MAG: glycosyltransferase family 2 protein [Candidatus Levyibacteriota bacterium]|nr:MAG: glycosyltransferase family 2 protein [Candidatus Levybacteria bacterium]
MGKKCREIFKNNFARRGKIIISIIIVHYKVEKELFDCLNSIEKSQQKSIYEIIVIDNNEEPTIKSELSKKFPNVIYIKTNKNIGFGAANNLGAKVAKGEFLFFLNPDTKVFLNTIDALINFLKNHHHAGIVAPLLLNKKCNPYSLQGSAVLTPFRAIMCLSFIQKLFPENIIYKEYYLLDWDKKFIREVDVIPGTAFLVRKKIFEEVGGFDERFFLFFEENDLCMRVKEFGYKIYITPNAKVMHLWGESTKSLPNTKEIFKKSREYYFQKYFGFFWASVVELFCR